MGFFLLFFFGTDKSTFQFCTCLVKQFTDNPTSVVSVFFSELNIKDDFKIIEFNPFTATSEEMDWYRKEVNPHGIVPSMVLPDGTIMRESAAICMYIAERYGKMLPKDGQESTYFS